MSARVAPNKGRGTFRREATVGHGGWTGRHEGVDVSKGRSAAAAAAAGARDHCGVDFDARGRSGHFTKAKMPSHVPRLRHPTVAARYQQESPPPPPPPSPTLPPPPRPLPSLPPPQRVCRMVKASATTRLTSPLRAKMHPAAGAGDALPEHVDPSKKLLIRYPLPAPPRLESSRQMTWCAGGPQVEKVSSSNVRSAKESLLVYVELRKQNKDMKPEHLLEITNDPAPASRKERRVPEKKQVKQEDGNSVNEKVGRSDEQGDKQPEDVPSDMFQISQHRLPSSPHLSALRLSSLSSVSSADGDDSMPEQREIRDRLRSWLSHEQLGVGRIKRGDRSKDQSGGDVTDGSTLGGSTTSEVSTTRHYERLSKELFQAATKCPLPPREAVAAVEKLKRRAARLIASQQIEKRDNAESRALSAPPMNHHPRRRSDVEETTRSSSEGEGEEAEGEEEEEDDEELVRELTTTPVTTTSEERMILREPHTAHGTLSEYRDISLRSATKSNDYLSCFSGSDYDMSSQVSLTSTTGVSSTTVVNVPQNNMKTKWNRNSTVHLAQACVLLVLSGVLLEEQRTLWNRDEPYHWEFTADGSVPIDFEWPFRIYSPELVVDRGWCWVAGAASVTAALTTAWGAVVGDLWAANAGPCLAAVSLASDAAALLYAGVLLVPEAGMFGAMDAISGPAAALGPRAAAIAASAIANMIIPNNFELS